MPPELIDALMTLAILGLLVWYRIKKRFKNDRTVKSFWGKFFTFLDHNIVELTFAGVLLPGLPGMIAQAISKWM